MADQQETAYEATTTAQVEQTFTVFATSEDQAHARLRTHLKDGSALRPGVITEGAKKDTTTRKITDVKALPAKTPPAGSGG